MVMFGGLRVYGICLLSSMLLNAAVVTVMAPCRTYDGFLV